MWIKSLSVESFASFGDRTELEFAPGINLIIGANNSGKTAILKSITTPVEVNPHRGLDGYLRGDTTETAIGLEIITTGAEISELLAETSQRMTIPLEGQEPESKQSAIDFFDNTEHISFSVTRGNPSRFSNPVPFSYLNKANTYAYLSIVNAAVTVSGYVGDENSLAKLFDHNITNTIFYLRPQRVAPEILPYGEASVLTPNGDNLQLVLTFLQNKRPDVFNEIVVHLNSIIGNVHEITVVPRGSGCEIMIWPTDRMDREELSFRLSDSGTGVAQCLTILVAASSGFPSCILIDEINSFLHPRAVRSLISILREYYNQHQYIVSTHSADVIAFASPSTAYFVEKTGFVSSAKSLDLKKIEDARSIYRSLGVSMMDVFGADRIFWVEGQTEEICFPLLLNDTEDMSGIIIKAVPATGDFTAKKRTKKMIIDLYNSVVSSVVPLIEGMVFSFDREDLSDETVNLFQSNFKDKVYLLPRRNIECYLINCHAITTVINSYIKENLVSEEIVRKWLVENGGKEIYSASKFWRGEITDRDWLKRVDGARLIGDLFAELSENRVEFRKTKHSSEILIEIKNANPKDIRELQRYIRIIINKLKKKKG